MAREALSGAAPGRLVSSIAGGERVQAFVPAGLPPELNLDASLFGRLSEADRALGELAGTGLNLPNPHILIRPFIRREAVASSRIEGTQADLSDLYKYEAGEAPAEPDRRSDVQEVDNYVRALEYGLERVDTLPVSLRLLRELHERLLRGVRGQHRAPGEFRSQQNWIGAPGTASSEARYIPPPVPEMGDALGELERYLHADAQLPPLVRIGLIHYQFEAIHPFVDGNGRIGRVLITLLLVHWELLSLPLLYLSSFFERNRTEYYDRLLAVSRRGEWHDWLEFFLTGVATQSRDAIDRATTLRELRAEWREQVMEPRASALLPPLIDFLFEQPILTIPQVERELDVAYSTAMRNVRRLVALGILEAGDRSYRKQYIANGILEAVAVDT